MKLNKIIEYIFYLIILILPLQTGFIVREIFINNSKLEYGTIIFYLSDLFIIFLFGFFIYSKYNDFNNKELYKNKKPFLFKIIILFVFWLFLSIFWSQDKELATYFFIKLITAVALFFVTINLKINIKKVFIIILISILLYSGLGLFQFFSQKTFSSTIFGLTEYNLSNPGVSIVDTPEKRWLRSYSVFPHPNIFGGYIVVLLFFLIYIFLNKKYSNNKKVLLIISLTILFLSLITSFSRSAWLSFFIGLIIIFVFNLYKKNKESNLKLIKIFSLFLLITIIFYLIFPNTIKSRLLINNEKENKSVVERVEYISQAKNIIKKNLLLGVGGGNYSSFNYIKDDIKQPGWYYQPVHNVYILIFTELGLIGILLFLTIIFYPLYFLIKNIKWIKNIIPFVVILSMLVIMVFDHYLWTTHFGIILFWIILGGVTKIFQDNNFMVK